MTRKAHPPLALVRTLLAAAALLAAVLVVPAAADAAEPRFRFEQANQVISVSPVVVEREAAPGRTTTVTVTVMNQTEQAFGFTTSFQDFEAGTQPREDKRFVDDAERGASSWLRVTPARFRLAGGEERELTVTVDVPAGAPPGGHYAALFVHTEPPEEGVVAIEARIAVLLLLTVEGAVRRDLDVRLVPESRIVLSPPVRWRLELRNGGNVHEVVGGRLRASAALAGEALEDVPALVVLPGGERHVPVEHDRRSAPDLVRGTLEYTTAAEGGDELRLRATAPAVLVLPWWLLPVLALLVGVLVWRLRTRGGWYPDDGGDVGQDADDASDGAWPWHEDDIEPADPAQTPPRGNR